MRDLQDHYSKVFSKGMFRPRGVSYSNPVSCHAMSVRVSRLLSWSFLFSSITAHEDRSVGLLVCLNRSFRVQAGV